jgi:hypothetical protein
MDPEGVTVPDHARGNFAMLVTCKVIAWGESVQARLVCAHLDADSPRLAAK